MWPQGPSISIPEEQADAGMGVGVGAGDEADVALGDIQLFSIFKFFLKAFATL